MHTIVPALRRVWTGVVPAILLCGTASAQEVLPTGFPARCADGQVQVMLLGTYHFAGSSGDAVQQDLVDVLAVNRQEQLADLVNRLAGWAPQQVFVEWPWDFADSTNARYQRYRAGTLAQSRNEVVQIAFRLASRLDHPEVHPFDYRLPLGNDSIAALAQRRPDLLSAGDSLLKIVQRRADDEGRLRQTTTIVEHLRRANSDEALRGGNSFAMFGAYLPGGEGTNFGGPMLLTRWYERNIRMAHLLVRQLKPDTRRALVLVGSGHVPPLRNVLHEAPQLCPVSPLPLLR